MFSGKTQRRRLRNHRFLDLIKSTATDLTDSTIFAQSTAQLFWTL
jgi:hypothetical protein